MNNYEYDIININEHGFMVNAMYEKEIIIHTVVMSHEACEVTRASMLSYLVLPEIRTCGRKYVHSLGSDNCNSCSC